LNLRLLFGEPGIDEQVMESDAQLLILMLVISAMSDSDTCVICMICVSDASLI
jgi:hypothetical protein